MRVSLPYTFFFSLKPQIPKQMFTLTNSNIVINPAVLFDACRTGLMSEPKKVNVQGTDYAAILNLHEETNVIHISGDTTRKLQNAEHEHHIDSLLIDNGEVRRRMSMIPAKFESKFPEYLRKESESEKKVCSETLRGNGACQIDQHAAVPLASIPRRVHVTIDPAVQVVSTKQCISRFVELCLNRFLLVYIIL